MTDWFWRKFDQFLCQHEWTPMLHIISEPTRFIPGKDKLALQSKTYRRYSRVVYACHKCNKTSEVK